MQGKAHKPEIKTAIPKRRYQVGEFTVVVLGEIESGDGIDYRYIAAVVREGESEPGMYVTAENPPVKNEHQAAPAMRLILRDGTEIIGASDDWNDLERFVEDALEVTVRVLNLGDQEPYRLM